MHVDHEAEIIQAHLGERFVAQDAGVVHKNIDPPPSFEYVVDHVLYARCVAHRAQYSARLTARSDDLLHDSFGVRAQVVHHHARSALRQQKRVGPTQPAAGARHNRHAARKIDHMRLPP